MFKKLWQLFGISSMLALVKMFSLFFLLINTLLWVRAVEISWAKLLGKLENEPCDVQVGFFGGVISSQVVRCQPRVPRLLPDPSPWLH